MKTPQQQKSRPVPGRDLLQKHLTVVIWFVALAVMAGAMLIFESDQLWKLQQKNLFLSSVLFLRDQLVVPGGLLTWVGTWFTQFFYYPWVGVLMLCCWWWILMAVTKHAFRIPDRWAMLMLIPVALLLVSNMGMGYWIYVLKLRGYFFVSTIGTTVVAILLWGFRCVPEKFYLRTVAIALTCVVGYPLLGVYGLAAAMLMAIWSWHLQTNRMEAVVNSVVAVLGVTFVILVCYRYVYHETSLDNMLWAELPLFFVDKEYHAYYTPYYLLALFFVVLAVTYQSDRITAKPIKQPYYLISQGLLALLLVGGVFHFWVKDENFHRELSMQHRIYDLDWTGVLQEAAAQQDEPTRSVVMMRNLALSRLGRQGNEMFLYKNGSKKYAAPIPMRLMMVVGPMIYYQYGMLNYCYRLSMEMGVEFGFHAEDYQLMANSALLEGDRPLARRYINALKQTLFYRDWALQAESLLEHPDRIASDPEREAITHMMHYENSLGGDKGYIERFLMSELAESTYTGDPIFQEQCLLATLWTKDIKQFWVQFANYARLHPDTPMPRYYQEAAYLYGKIEGRRNLDSMPFDVGIKETFERFAASARRYDNADMAVAREMLYPFFGETYFYDYFAMKKLAEY